MNHAIDQRQRRAPL